MVFLKKTVLLLTISFFLVKAGTILAQDAQNDLIKKINEYQQKLTEIRQQKNTLSSQIQYMDTQIYLTSLKIQDTEQKIKTTQKEIDLLSSRIEGLDDSLDYLSKLLLKKIVEGYKNRSLSVFDLLFDSGNVSDLMSRIKYLKITQENNQKLIVQVQTTKLNFEEQKKLREEKKVELAHLKVTLDQQQNNLETQQKSKKNLLIATNNDEVVYQNLLEKARRELAGYSAFAQSAGGGLTSFGNGSNGWYYTQRDPQWGNMILPGSSSSLLLAGCAVTSVAMVCKSYGQDITPATIASNDSNFINGDLWNWAFSCNGKTTDWIGTSQDQVKSYVNNNNPVILRLIAPSVSGLHFIVAFSWDSEKNDFKIHDPYYGPDKYFSERYDWSQVTTAIAIH